MQKKFQNSRAMPLSVDPVKLIKPETTLNPFSHVRHLIVCELNDIQLRTNNNLIYKFGKKYRLEVREK